MDISKIKQLIDLMEERALAELAVEDGDKKVAITRHLPQANLQTVTTTAAPPAQTTIAPTKTGITEKSPMVGVFYVAPSPNDAPFIKVGQQVQAGDTLGIIEAMKILNEIEADKSGLVKKVCCDNGQGVEYGQALFIIE